MLLKRQGFPEESDLVMCTVVNIQHNSVFVSIHEYDRQGMITISEIAPGRIRNIRDYVSEGRVIVCKVLNVNKERGYIDLSLRRATEGQKRIKTDEIKQETRAEKIIELTAKSLKVDMKKFYDEISTKLLGSYFYIYQAFDDVIKGNLDLKQILDEKAALDLEKNIREKIKPKELIVANDIALSTWEENGLELVKSALTNSLKNKQNSKISYLGGGKFRIIVRGIDFKTIEKTLKDITDSIVNAIKKRGIVEYSRVKNISVESE